MVASGLASGSSIRKHNFRSSLKFKRAIQQTCSEERLICRTSISTIDIVERESGRGESCLRALTEYVEAAWNRSGKFKLAGNQSLTVRTETAERNCIDEVGHDSETFMLNASSAKACFVFYPNRLQSLLIDTVY